MDLALDQPPAVPTRPAVPAKVVTQRLVQERRAQIIAAATDLFLHRGFHSTSIRQIAAALGWNMGTLYLYISSKQDILYLIADAIMAELWSGLESVPRGQTATESMCAEADYFFRAVNRMRREVKLLYRESASLSPEHLESLKDSELKERAFLAAIIRWGIERGEFKPVSPEFYAHNLIMLAHMWALKGWALAGTMSFDAYREHQIQQFMQNLKHPAGSSAVEGERTDG